MRGRLVVVYFIISLIAVVILSFQLYRAQRRLVETEWLLLNAEFKIWALTQKIEGQR